MFCAIFLLYLCRYQMIRCGWQMWLFFVKTQKHTKHFFAFQTLVFVASEYFFCVHPPKCMFLFSQRVSKCSLWCAADRCYLKFECFHRFFLLFFNFFPFMKFFVKQIKGKMRMWSFDEFGEKFFMLQMKKRFYL